MEIVSFFMSVSMTLPFDLFSFQLGYVIYRRVLRYYSGEEDGLGEHLNLARNLLISLLLYS